MRTGLYSGLLLLAVTLSATQSWSRRAVQVGERWYEEEGDKWYVLDPVGARWEIARGFMEIKFRDSASSSEKDAVRQSAALTKAQRKKNALGYERHTFDSARNPAEVLQMVSASAMVDRAYLSTRIKVFGSANDTFYSQQWYLSHTGVNSAWDVTTGSSAITVAVIDDGIDYEHEDLEANIWQNPGEVPGDGLDNDGDSTWYGSPLIDDAYGWDFLDSDNDPRPNSLDDHGTGCAGLVAATRNNQQGIAGVAGGNDGVGPKLVSLRTWYDGTVADALEYCWRKGVEVVSMSIGVFDQTGSVAAQIDSAHAHGLVLVAAAGNYQQYHAVAFPASHPNVIAVGATDFNDEWLSYSSFGPTLDITAPSGVIPGPEPQIFTTDNYQVGAGFNPAYCACPASNDRYFSKFTGTSASAPQVAGIAALLLSHRPSLGNSGVRTLVTRSAVDLGDPGWDELTGHGRVDALAAITMADQIVQGPITTNTTWSGILWVSGDITVASGVVLTVNSGATIFIDKSDGQSSGFHPDKIEFNIAGSIDVNGTTNSPVIFRSFDQQAGDWIGFYFDEESGGGAFDHVRIKNAEFGIETHVPVQVNNSVFEDCAYAGVVVQAGASQITNTAMRDCGAWGVYNTAPAPATVVVSSCLVDGATGAAFHVHDGSIIELDGVTARNGAKGVYVAPLASASISGSIFSTNDMGVNCYGASATTFISSHADSNLNEGILCDNNSNLVITESSFDRNDSGIVALNDSDPYIRDCELNANYIGMWCASGAEPDAGTVSGFGNNSVVGSTNKHVANFTDNYTFQAIGNWYGAYPPAPRKFQNAVDYMPALTGPPALIVNLHPPQDPAPNGFISTMPNPFNPAITVLYGVTSPERVSLTIYNVKGELVALLFDERKPAGRHIVTWNGADGKGQPVASGIYFARMVIGGIVQTRKLALVR